MEASALARVLPSRRAAVVWFAAALVLLPFARLLDRPVAGGSVVRGSESARAERRLRDDFDSMFGDPALLVMSGLAHAADSDSGRADVRAIIAPLLASHVVLASLSPGSALDTLLVGADHHTAIAIVGLDRRAPAAIDSVRAITSARLAELRRAHPRLALKWTGQDALVQDLHRAGAAESRRAELRALPVTFVVALIAFESLWSAGIAVLIALAAISVTLGAAGLLSLVLPASEFTRMVVPLVGLALAVDYVLFLMRQSRLGVNQRTLTKTVALAAGVVALGFVGLALAPTGELRGAALAGVLTCAAAALAAITLAPVDRSRASNVPVPAGVKWLRWGFIVAKYRWLVLLASAVPLVALAMAAQSARLLTPMNELLVSGVESTDAVRELQRVDRGSVAGSLRVVLELPANMPVMSDAGWAALERTRLAVGNVPGVSDVRTITTIGTRERLVALNVLPSSVRSVYVSRDGNSAVLDVLPDLHGNDVDASRAVRGIRALDGARASGVAGARLIVSGLPAYAIDYETALRVALPWIVAATSIATLIALLIGLRAPVIAVKAVALNLLVAAAAIGATVLVFQRGFGAALIGQHALGSIFPTVPALAFGAAFGTSMDYELFLVSAVLDAKRGGAVGSEAIIVGLGRVGGLITRAAAVMACLFLAFSTSALLPLAMVGFTLAVAVVLDATLVRLALAPAILCIAGRWNWWPRN